MKQLLFILFCLLTIGGLHARNTSTGELYGLGNWDADSLGNHRVVVSVEKPADAVWLLSNGAAVTRIRKIRI